MELEGRMISYNLLISEFFFTVHKTHQGLGSTGRRGHRQTWESLGCLQTVNPDHDCGIFPTFPQTFPAAVH